MRRRNDYAKCLAKVLELGVLMNTPIKEGGAKKTPQKDPSIPVFVPIGIRGYNLLNIKHIKYLTSTKTLICTFDGDSFEEKIPFEEAEKKAIEFIQTGEGEGVTELVEPFYDDMQAYCEGGRHCEYEVQVDEIDEEETQDETAYFNSL